VALVVTIVVLLILAGITIVYIFGENGVFGQASEAKLKTDIAKWQERLEVAKSPVFMEGLGTFDPDKYFDYIEKQEIINNKETDVIDNEDGTYDVTTKPGYVFLVTLVPNTENPTDAEIEYLGQAGKLLPKIKGIKVTGKTKTSIDIKVSARLEGGTVSCYYKKASEVVEGELENSIEGYTAVTLDENLSGSITGLTEGTAYKIKAVLQKDREDIGWVSIEEKTGIIVTSIILDKTIAKVVEEETIQLTATVKPDNAEDKTVTWSSSNTDIATVSSNGKVTGVKAGTTTITVVANDGNGVKATCSVTVEELDSDWEEIGEIAKAIARSSVTSNDSQATVTVNGESKTIKVGDIYKLKYNGEIRRVKVLGFKHDDLVDTGVYGEGITANKASISFEFYDFMTGNIYKPMNSSATNSGGWGATEMRAFLNGAEGKEKLSNKSYIKNSIKNPVPQGRPKIWWS